MDVLLDGETLWLGLNQLAGLFARDKSVVSRHLRNIFKTGELDREATVVLFAAVQDERGRSVELRIQHFNLDAIISVGYRTPRRYFELGIYRIERPISNNLKGDYHISYPFGYLGRGRTLVVRPGTNLARYGSEQACVARELPSQGYFPKLHAGHPG